MKGVGDNVFPEIKKEQIKSVWASLWASLRWSRPRKNDTIPRQSTSFSPLPSTLRRRVPVQKLSAPSPNVPSPIASQRWSLQSCFDETPNNERSPCSRLWSTLRWEFVWLTYSAPPCLGMVDRCNQCRGTSMSMSVDRADVHRSDYVFGGSLRVDTEPPSS